MTQHKRRSGLLLAALALMSLSGCAAEDTAATTAELTGDLARQLLTFWLL